MNAYDISYFERTTHRALLSLAGSFALAALALGAGGCGGDDDDDDGGGNQARAGAPGAEPTAYAGCEWGALEADLVGGDDDVPAAQAPQWQGPGVDPTTGALKPGTYVISSTYLAQRPEPAARQRFGELVEPLTVDLQTRPGLVAVAFSASTSCASARTLSVWESEEAMYAFVASPAHSAAVSSASEVSRGTSAVTHWSGGEADATWTKAAEELGRDAGLGY